MRKIIWTFVLVVAAALLVGCSLTGGQPQSENINSTIEALEATQARQMEYLNYQFTQVSENRMLIGTLQANAGVEEQTGPPRPTDYVNDAITGSVLIEGGSCCVGGTVGDTLQVSVEFEANSPNGEVTEMRVVTGVFSVSTDEIENVPWQPFASEQVYDVYVPINWTGYWVSVQFRDESGGVSEIFSDDISVEGAPEGPGG